MIDRDPGEKTIETLVKSQDEVCISSIVAPHCPYSLRLHFIFQYQRYIDRGIRTYTWAPVNGTDYRFVGFTYAKCFITLPSICMYKTLCLFPMCVGVLQPGLGFAWIQSALHRGKPGGHYKTSHVWVPSVRPERTNQLPTLSKHTIIY